MTDDARTEFEKWWREESNRGDMWKAAAREGWNAALEAAAKVIEESSEITATAFADDVRELKEPT